MLGGYTLPMGLLVHPTEDNIRTEIPACISANHIDKKLFPCIMPNGLKLCFHNNTCKHTNNRKNKTKKKC